MYRKKKKKKNKIRVVTFLMFDHCEILILYKTTPLEYFAKKLAQSSNQNKSYAC